jgi:membrane dipeptidase
MTAAEKNTGWKLSGDADVRPLTRRRFLSTLLSCLASAYAAPPMLDYFRGETGVLAEAAELSQELVTVDLHCHPNLVGGGKLPEFDPEVPDNMRAGGLDVGVFAIRGDLGTIRRDTSGLYTEYRKANPDELFRRSQQQLDKILDAGKAGKIALAHSPEDILEAKKKGSLCVVLAIEGSDPLEGDLSRVKFFYDRGVRVLQLMHYRINEIGDIQTEDPRHKGLTPFGRDVVKEMNKLGMVIDVAHASSETLSGILAESRHPVICSHTGAYALWSHARHLENKDMTAIAKKGGIIGIWPLLRRRDTLETYLRAIDYVKNLVGADHVGIATDLFGLAGSSAVPTHKEFALIPAGLLQRGYSQSDVAKIAGGNFMRVFTEISARVR